MSPSDPQIPDALELLETILQAAPEASDVTVPLDERLAFQRALVAEADGTDSSAVLSEWVRDHAD